MRLAIACCIPCLAIAYGVTHPLAGWDDGIITAAFARTLAHTGHLRLTPLSASVEGTSSLLWTLLLTPAAWLSASPWAIVIWMKLAAGCAFLGSLFLLYRLGNRLFSNRTQALVATLLFALCITPFTETINGMEANCLVLLTLGFTLAMTRTEERFQDTLIASVFASLALLTRWESPFLLAAILLGVWLYQRRIRQVLTVAAAIVVVFLAISIWRHTEFHLWMPNTVYAKRWHPYQLPGLHQRLISRAKAIAEILLVAGWPVLMAIHFRIARQPKNNEAVRPSALPLLIPVVVGMIVFSLALGHNWGHAGRMVLGFLPFLFLLCVAVVFQAAANESAAIRLLLIGQSLCWLFGLAQATFGSHLPFASSLRGEGQLAEQVRRQVGSDRLTLLTPDVGITSLCCERLQIADSALLTSPLLAERGWAAFPQYFDQVQPDLIITQDVWSDDSHIYDLPELAGYGMIGGFGFRAYLRGDIYRQLLARGAVEIKIEDVPDCAHPAGEKSSPVDDHYAQTRSVCIHIQPEP